MPQPQGLDRKGISGTSLIPVSVIIPVRNEAKNLNRCLASLNEFAQVYVVDSQSEDETVEIARSHHAEVVQFFYKGGWPKKRQWALDNLPLVHEWVFLLDADEALTVELTEEIRVAITSSDRDGYYVSLQMVFLNQRLRFCGASFWKMSLFRRGRGSFECRLREQDQSMADMEVHEHVQIQGRTGRLKNPLNHHNVNSLSRYFQKHNEYSNWEARVWLKDEQEGLPPRLFGGQAQRRRWLKRHFLAIPGSPLLFFLYKYVFCLGFLDGIPGLLYCSYQGIQFFNIKAKIYELRVDAHSTDAVSP